MNLKIIEPNEDESLPALWRSLLGNYADELIEEAYRDAANGLHLEMKAWTPRKKKAKSK